jgi:FkbM family methyltransferase
MLKNALRKSAQQLLGFNRYLFLFSLFNIYRIRIFKAEKAFRFFMRMIPPETNVLDIGANIGINTVILAKTFPKATVHAFEPIKENYETLEKVIRFFNLDNVRVYKTALGDHGGNASMVMPQHKGSKMQGWSRMKEVGNMEGENYVVPLQQLDEVISGLPIGAIKIDVENFEYFVLRGGMEGIKKNKPIIFCELWNDERRQMCFDFLCGMGYSVMIYSDGKLVPHNGEDALNYFFVGLKK